MTPRDITNLPSPVRIKALSRYLEGCPNKSFIVSGFQEGFQLGFQGPQSSSSCHNSPSITQHHDIVQQKLNIELSLNRISGPYSKPPLPHFKTSPLALIPKRVPGKYRLIHNLSFPYDINAVNFNIPAESATVKYQTVNDAIHLIQRHSPEAFLAKTDIADAFRLIPVHPDQYNLLGFTFDGHYYYDKMLCMGAASSCQIFEQFSDALLWILKHKFYMTSVVKVLDDFLFVQPSFDRCQRDLNTFLHLCRDLGVPIAQHKTEGPANVLTFLGLELDTLLMEARLPQDKLVTYTQDVANALTLSKISLRDLQSIIGKLQFATRVIPSGRAFLRRLHNLTIGIEKPFYFIRLTRPAKLDLSMWLSFLNTFNGVTIISPRARCPSREATFCSDSSKLGFGITYQDQWMCGLWPPHWQTLNIAVLELYPIFMAISMFSTALTNSHVTFFTDNNAVVEIVNKQSSKCNVTMQIIRPLVLVLLKYNITLLCKHIAGIDNTLCDSLSRQKHHRQLLHQYGMRPESTPIPNHLLPNNFSLAFNSS